ncbi:hypothetical protein IE077_002287, partial [Cardiosporidium cionae]
DKWLREWQQSPSAWETADGILNAKTIADEVYCFAAQTLRSKIMYDFVELPADFHERLCEMLLQHLSMHRAKRPTANMLSLAVADFSIQTALVWENPVQTLMQRYVVDSEGVRTLLLLLKHLPEETTNSRVMADASAKAAHTKNIKAASLQVIQFLVEILQNSDDPFLKGEALSCWLSWIVFNDGCIEEVDCHKLFLDCFRILTEDIPPPPTGGECEGSHAASTGAIALRSADIHEIAVDCLCVILKWMISHPLSPVAITLKESALQQCIGNLQSIVANAIKEEALEELTRLSPVLSYTASANLLAIHLSIDQDMRLQRLLQMLMQLTECLLNFNYLKEETVLCGSDEELFLYSLLKFWNDLAETLSYLPILSSSGLYSPAKQSSESPVGPSVSPYRWAKYSAPHQRVLIPHLQSTPAANQMLKDLLLRLIDVFIRLCIPSLTFLEEEITSEFDHFRQDVMDCLRNCAIIFGFEEILQHILNSSISFDHTPLSYANVDGRLAIAQLLCEDCVTIAPRTLAFLNQWMEPLEILLHPGPPTSPCTAYVRYTAVSFLKSMVKCGQDSPEFLQHLLRLFLSQVLIFADSNSPFITKFFQQYPLKSSLFPPRTNRENDAFSGAKMKKVMKNIQSRAARGCLHLCKTSNASSLLYGCMDILCEVCADVEKNSIVSEEVRCILLESMSTFISKIPEDDRFLSLLEALCNPTVMALRQADANEILIMLYLDRLSVILRDILPGVQKYPVREEALSAFIIQTLWPLIDTFMLQFVQQSHIIEHCCRLVKHAVRCIGIHAKRILPRFIEIVIAGAHMKMQSTYLYVVEWMGKAYLQDTEMYPRIVELFHHLGNQGLSEIEQHKDDLQNYPELVEDCYGMLGRFLWSCPVFVVDSPILPRAILLAKIVCHMQQSDAAYVVFVFLDNLILLCRSINDSSGFEKERLIASKIQFLVETQMKDLFQEFFILLTVAPPLYILDYIELVIGDAVSTFPEKAGDWIRAGFEILPRSVLPSQSMKENYVENFLCGDDRLQNSLQDIYNRCEQLVLRNRRGHIKTDA